LDVVTQPFQVLPESTKRKKEAALHTFSATQKRKKNILQLTKITS
jgi:hypothetical protein